MRRGEVASSRRHRETSTSTSTPTASLTASLTASARGSTQEGGSPPTCPKGPVLQGMVTTYSCAVTDSTRGPSNHSLSIGRMVAFRRELPARRLVPGGRIEGYMSVQGNMEAFRRELPDPEARTEEVVLPPNE